MKELIKGGRAIASYIGVDADAFEMAVLYEALPVFELGGELFATPCALSRWLSGHLMDWSAQPSADWHAHMSDVVAGHVASMREAA